MKDYVFRRDGRLIHGKPRSASSLAPAVHISIDDVWTAKMLMEYLPAEEPICEDCRSPNIPRATKDGKSFTDFRSDK